MSIEEIKMLPDRIASEECNKYFQEIISLYIDKKITKREFLKTALELTNRQIMTYDLLKTDIRDKMDKCILSLWNTESYEDVDSILSIVVNLGLIKTYELIKQTLKFNKEIKHDILEEIKECIEENGEDISNPYRFLEN